MCRDLMVAPSGWRASSTSVDSPRYPGGQAGGWWLFLVYPGALQSFSMWYVETRQAPRWTRRLFFGSKSFRLNIFRKKWPSVVGPCWKQFPDADSCLNFPWSGTVQKPIDCFNFWLAVLWVQQLGPFGGVLEPFLLRFGVALRRGCSLCEA